MHFIVVFAALYTVLRRVWGINCVLNKRKTRIFFLEMDSNKIALSPASGMSSLKRAVSNGR
jgi:hypothetical protein